MHQPHDKLVKRMMSSLDTARDIFNEFLPEEILREIDLSQLELQRDSFIDDEHKMNAVDLLYKTVFQDKETYIWILLEHQRQSDYWMPVRIFKYMAIIWDHIRRTSKSETLPLIFSMIIYNGEREYHHSLNLMDLIEPESGRQIFRNMFSTPFCLVDLTQIPDEELRRASQKRVKGMAMLMALKHVYDENLEAFIRNTYIRILRRMDEAGDSDTVADILYFMLNVARYIDKEELWIKLQSDFSERVESKMKTLEEIFVERGMRKGIELGRLESQTEIAKNFFTTAKNFNFKGVELFELAYQLTGLSIEELKLLSLK